MQTTNSRQSHQYWSNFQKRCHASKYYERKGIYKCIYLCQEHNMPSLFSLILYIILRHGPNFIYYFILNYWIYIFSSASTSFRVFLNLPRSWHLMWGWTQKRKHLQMKTRWRNKKISLPLLVLWEFFFLLLFMDFSTLLNT